MNLKNITFLVCVLIIGISCDFIPQRTVVVDSNEQNFLIRGNLPLQNTTFQIEQLKSTLSEITGLKQFNLIVYSLMNLLTVRQTRRKYLEQQFFENHQEYKYVNNPVLGSFIDPKSIPKFLRDIIVPYYEYLSVDNLSNLLQEFRQTLQTQKKPTVIYFHCSQGVDRTGYVHAAYSMKYQNKSLQEAYKLNLKVLNNMRTHMHFNTYFGIEWYCLVLGHSDEECLKGLQN